MRATKTIVRVPLKRLCLAGSAAIEFGLAAPLFLFLLIGAVELGFAMYEAMQVQNAAEAGILYAAKNGWDVAGITQAVVNATGTPGIEATPPPTQFCGCPDLAGVVETSCGAPCADGSPAGLYGQVNATLVHRTLLPYPRLPLPSVLTAKSILRLY